MLTLRSMLFGDAGSNTLNTASTAIGANKLDCCETTFELSDVDAHLVITSRSSISIGVDTYKNIKPFFEYLKSMLH